MLMTLAQYGPHGMRGYYAYGADVPWWMMALHGGFRIVVAVLVITLIVLAIRALWRWSNGKPVCGHHKHGHGALAILDERFAKGEIDREEYLARKAVLREGQD